MLGRSRISKWGASLELNGFPFMLGQRFSSGAHLLNFEKLPSWWEKKVGYPFEFHAWDLSYLEWRCGGTLPFVEVRWRHE